MAPSPPFPWDPLNHYSEKLRYNFILERPAPGDSNATVISLGFVPSLFGVFPGKIHKFQYRKCAGRYLWYETKMPNKYLALWSAMRNERRPPAELARLQDAKLRRLVRHAYDYIPFYRELFASHGVQPENIHTAEDLPKLPVIDKRDLKAHPLADLISDRSGSTDALVRLSTSGSSGMPLELFIDPGYAALRKAQSLRPYLTNGRHLSDRTASCRR